MHNLHGLDAQIALGDALTDDVAHFSAPDLVLANPPFGVKAGSQRALRSDIRYPGANKQLAFLQHIYGTLKDGGRAAVILPDSVLFEDGLGKLIRQELMDCCNLHTIIRLPNGIFAGAGVKTNALFFSKTKNNADDTQSTWFYDLRSNMQPFGKNNSLTMKHFEEFEKLFGTDPFGRSKREEGDKESRWRKLTRRQIVERNYDLNWSWLRDESGHSEDELSDPDEIAAAILRHVQAALDEIQTLNDGLVGTPLADVSE